MSAEKDITLDEKRVYGAKQAGTELFVACGVGLLRVSVSDALVGEFGLVHRGDVHDVAASGGVLVVATDEDVLLGLPGEGAEDGEGVAFEATGFGPAVAVSARGGPTASDGERVARYEDGEWVETAELDGVRSLDGGLVAAAGGVYRTDGTALGLPGARDVDAAGTPLAATDDGLYYLGNGWMRAVDRDSRGFRVVAADDTGGRAHAAGERLYERREPRAGEGLDADWSPVEVSGEVVGVAHAETTYAVTRDGTLWAFDPAEDAWRERTLGVPDVRALAVVAGTDGD
jgi:hypothetical protein